MAPELIPASGAILKLTKTLFLLEFHNSQKERFGGFQLPGIPSSSESLTAFDNAGRLGLFQKGLSHFNKLAQGALFTNSEKKGRARQYHV